jgi:hypothetical protein
MLEDTRNGKKYIGKHIGNDKNYWSGGVLPNRIAKKYGKDIFERIIVEDNIPNDLLNDKEKFYIKKYNTLKDGYNLTEGGDGGDTMSNNPNKLEITNKISKKLKNRIFTDEHLIKLKENHMSKDEINREKLSKALKGKIKSEEHRKKLSDSLKGFKHKDETKAKIKIALNNQEVKDKLLKLNRERANKKRENNIKNFIYELNNDLINKDNIKIYRYRLYIWKRDLSEYEYNILISSDVIKMFQELSEKIKLENKKNNHFFGKKHSNETKKLISLKANINNEKKKESFLKFCNQLYDLMKNKKINYLCDLYDKDTYFKIRKKIKSSPFLNFLSEKTVNLLLAIKPKKNKNIKSTSNNVFYGNENKNVFINGIIYDSVSDAAKKLMINRGTIRYRLKNDNFSDYKYIL